MRLYFMKLFSRTTVRSAVIIMTVIFNFAFLGLLFFKEIPEANKDMVNILGGGIVLTSVGGVYQFLFGQSKAAEKKTVNDE